MKDGWEEKSLGELCEYRRGLTYKKGDEVDRSDNAVLRANNISLEDGRLNLDEIRYISDDLDVPASKRVVRDSLLVCTASGSKSHLGKIALIEDDIDFAFGGFMGLLVPNRRVLPRFLFWLTRSELYASFIGGLADGTNINNLKWSQLGQLPIPLPPLVEQRRIVAILDEAFAGLAVAVENTKRNLASARELFESELNRVFSEGGEGWEEKRLGEVCEFQNGYAFKSSWYSAEGRRLLRNANISHGSIDWSSEVVRLPEEMVQEFRRFELDVDDVVLSLDRPLISTGLKAALVTQADVPSLLLQRVLRITSDHLIPRFLYHWLFSVSFIGALNPGRSVGVPHVSAGEIGAMSISFPSREVQRESVGRIDFVREQIDRLCAHHQRKLTALAELKQSLLQKAFAGELTAEFVDSELAEVGA